MKRITALIVALVAAVTFAVAAAPASAHYTDSEASAIAKVRNAFPGRCGNGLIWWCNSDPSPSSDAPLYGSHSRYVTYQWIESRPGLIRGCNVLARVEHGAVVQIYRYETCW